LAQADRIVTPHAELADLFHAKALRLDWAVRPVQPARPDPAAARCIAFPGPSVARKGAFELRAVARALDLDVMLLGSDLEGPDFWRGVRILRASAEAAADSWLTRVAAVVQPAQFEEQPRHLLAALAAGIPVIATAGCGLARQTGLTIIPHGDPDALAAAIRPTLGQS
jgi:glycosyltransferase involved in cell wall biosynthesis